MPEPEESDRVRLRPGPPKGRVPLVGDTGRTRHELMLEAGFALANDMVRPTIDAVGARQPLLSEAYLKANSRLLEPCRDRYRELRDLRDRNPVGEEPAAGTAPGGRAEADRPDFTNVVALAEARERRALALLDAERRALAATKERLRQAEAVLNRLLKGYADEN